MRTIKFRGKDVETGEWIYGDLFQRIGYYPEIIVSYPNDDGKIAYKGVTVKPGSVCQFTGLLDKNGKEIYEGDIIHLKWNNYDKDFGIVKWHTDGYFYIDDNFGKFPKDKTNPIGNFFDFIRRDFKGIEASISGNIHDNPDLLKNND